VIAFKIRITIPKDPAPVIRTLAICLVAVVAVPLFAADHAVVTIHRDVPSLTDPVPVIIELDRTRVTSKRDAFSSLRRDLAAIERGGGSARVEAIGEKALDREYTTVFFGAATTATPAQMSAIAKLPYVRRVVRDQTMHALSTGAKLATLATVDAAARINASGLPTRGAGITVAVIDTGIDYKHSAFGGGFGPGHKVAGGWDFVNNDDDPIDDAGHGTHVAGIIAANSPDLAGVAPEATLLAYKVLDSKGSGEESDVIAAIERATDPNGDGDPSDHVDVINLSLGGRGTSEDPGSQAVNAAVAAGVVVCVAAGNDGENVSISAPGAARDAITVGASDETDHTAFFTSRGPARDGRSGYSFKPDLVAPGNLIESAAMGGGLIRESGTSMAAPHVAGAAALLRALHRDWTPAQIKSALAMASKLISNTVWARGAGRIDVQKASETTVFADLAGVSFGLNAKNSGTYDDSRTFTVRNTGDQAQTFTLAATAATPSVLTVTASPSTLTLDPGATGEVTINVTADNAAVPYPADFSGYGDVTLTSGSTTLHVPWAMLRAARARVTYDRILGELTALGHAPTGVKFASAAITQTSDSTAEFLGDPKTKYDLLMFAPETAAEGTPADTLRFVIKEDVVLTGDDSIELNHASAKNEIAIAGVDEAGNLLAHKERIKDHRVRAMTVRMNFKKDTTDAALSYTFSSPRRILIPDLGAPYVFGLHEVYLDSDNHRAYATTYGPFSNIRENRTLTNQPSQYSHAVVRFRPMGEDFGVGLCPAIADTRQNAVSSFTQCVTFVRESGAVAYDLYVTPDTDDQGHVGISFNPSWGLTPAFRSFGSYIGVADSRSLNAASLRLNDGDEVTLGVGPFYPYYLGLDSRAVPSGSYAAFRGPADERFAGSAADWVLYDENGDGVASGQWKLLGTGVPNPVPNHRLELTSQNITVNGYPAESRVVTRWGAGADTFAPSFSSLRVLNADGHPADVLRSGERVTLLFSAMDWSKGGTIANKSTATTVAYRIHGTSEWKEVPVTMTGTDYGTRTEIGHLGAGELYKADLTAAAATDNARIDLRIEIEDASGNHVTWTQEPALQVGSPTTPARRRVAGR
jgi:subtilisin family serine protease